MSNLEQIEAAILSLPSNEFERLRTWFFDLDYERWDEQLEQDMGSRIHGNGGLAIISSDFLGKPLP